VLWFCIVMDLFGSFVGLFVVVCFVGSFGLGGFCVVCFCLMFVRFLYSCW